MSRSIKKQGRKVEIRNFLYIFFLLVFIGIVGFRMSQSIYFGNWFYGSDGKHASDSSFTRILRLQYGTTMPPTTTTLPPTTTTLSTCTHNNVCQLTSGSYGDDADENQARCPSDCKTTVSLIPQQSSPNQQVTITIAFNDSRYATGGKTSYTLLIDNSIVWDSSNGCNIAGVQVTPPSNQYNAACTWQGITWPCTSTSVNGYLSITTNCRMPDVQPGSHTLKVTPTIYSKPKQLNAITASFVVKPDQYTISTLFKMIISFLGLNYTINY